MINYVYNNNESNILIKLVLTFWTFFIIYSKIDVLLLFVISTVNPYHSINIYSFFKCGFS